MADTDNTPTVPEPVTEQPTTETQPVQTAEPVKPVRKFDKKKLTLLALIAAVGVVLLGGGAGAYYGVIVPNKPENVLKTATKNFLLQRQMSAKGKLSVDMTAKDAELKNITVNFTSASDNDKKAFNVNLEASASGVKLPVEVRGVEQNLYFKVGDLSSLKSVAALAGAPEASAIIDSMGSKVSNQWIEVDQSLLKQVNASCTTDAFNGFTQKDVDQLFKIYNENTFVTVKGTAKDTVDGVKTTKYDLKFDKTKAEAFGKKLDTLDALKKISECGKSANGDTGGDKEIKDDMSDTQVTFQVWVDGSKRIKQIELKVVDKEATGTTTIIMTNEKVNITKPEGAKPLMQILGDFSQLFGGGLGSGALGSDAGSDLSAECLAAYQAFAASGGTTTLPASCN